MTDKQQWQRVKFGDVVKLNTERCVNPAEAGIERYVGLEHIEPEDLRIRRWGFVSEGTTFTNLFRPGQTLFGKRRAYQRKVAVADFTGICSGDIYVFESKDLVEVLEHEAGDTKMGEKGADVQEIINYRHALSLAQEVLADTPITLSMIRQMHKVLMGSVRGQDKAPGEFRKDQSWIGRPGCKIGEATFVPPARYSCTITWKRGRNI